MSWTTPADLTAQLDRLWDRGELLRPLVTGERLFPLRLRLKRPTAAELTDRFEAVRAWQADLAALRHIRLEWREARHRVHGLQRLPQHVWNDSVEDALTLINKRRAAARYEALVEYTRGTLPALLPWLARRPLQAIDLAEQWSGLLAVVGWLLDHPQPGIYLRQVDVPGVHSKFIEANRPVLSELFDLVLPVDSVVTTATGIGRFSTRYGFLEKPRRIRFRLLDARIGLLSGSGLADITLDAASFASLDIPVRRVFITENETNFLAFPPAAGAIVIFGAGYGWDALAQARWVGECNIHYWGDIDTHGFAILDQLRSRFPLAASFLMDRETLMAHAAFWGEEVDQVLHDLPRLTPEERGLFDELRDNRIRAGLRLEQERVGFHWVTEKLSLIK